MGRYLDEIGGFKCILVIKLIIILLLNLRGNPLPHPEVVLELVPAAGLEELLEEPVLDVGEDLELSNAIGEDIPQIGLG